MSDENEQIDELEQIRQKKRAEHMGGVHGPDCVCLEMENYAIQMMELGARSNAVLYTAGQAEDVLSRERLIEYTLLMAKLNEDIDAVGNKLREDLVAAYNQDGGA